MDQKELIDKIANEVINKLKKTNADVNIKEKIDKYINSISAK